MTTILPRVASFAVLFAMGCMPRVEAADAPVATSPDSLLAALTGRWIVDLRPSPEDPKYDKPMTLAIAADRTVSGTFYESEIEAGRASASTGAPCVSNDCLGSNAGQQGPQSDAGTRSLPAAEAKQTLA